MPSPERIVCLCPSLTELVFRLGAGEHLVAITRYCIHPKEALERIESIGGTKDPELERIRQLEPDLVLLNREENRREDAQALAAFGLRCHSTDPRTVEEAAAMIRELGPLLGRSREADHLADQIDRELQTHRPTRTGAISFAYLIWRRPWMSANRDTYVHDLLVQTGGENVFAGFEPRYPIITPEQLAKANPELVLLSSEPFPFRDEHADELALLAGLPRDRFHLVDGERLSWHGSRTLEGINYAASLWHPRTA